MFHSTFRFSVKNLRGISAAVTYYWVMNNQDQQLHRLLQRWHEIEPSPRFDAAVWRRIAETTPAQPSNLLEWLHRWLPQPAFACATAVIIGAVIGFASGLFSVTPERGFGLLGPDTLAGSYIRLAQR